MKKADKRIEVVAWINLLWDVIIRLPGFEAEVRTKHTSSWRTERGALKQALKLGKLTGWPVYWRGAVVTFNITDRGK